MSAAAHTLTHKYNANVQWQRDASEAFTDQRYSRRHELRFDGGAIVAASSAVSSVPLPWSDPSAIDPEEMLVAAIASCHMLWFLSLAAKAGHVVDRYSDAAEGVMTKNVAGKLWVSQVTLRPQVSFAEGRAPTSEVFDALHDKAHEECFIVNSVKSEVRCEPQLG
jgi:organic hydroperoxide reductase OsmC/OhrA